MVGHEGHGDPGRDGRQALQALRDALSASLELLLHGVFVLGEQPIHRRNQPDDFFLGDFHAPADGVGVRGIVLHRGLDQVLPTQ